MKNFFFIIILIFSASCSQKNKTAENLPDQNIHATYDTTAIDSFATGAISVDVAEQIRKSSIAYQDSIKQALLKQEEERKQKEAEEKLKKEEEKAAEKTKTEKEIPKAKEETTN